MPGSLVQEEKRLDVEVEPRKEAIESEDEECGDGGAAAQEEDVEGNAAGAAGASAAAKKKKKKKKKKSGSGAAAAAAAAGEAGEAGEAAGAATTTAGAAKSLGYIPAQDNSRLRCLGSWPEVKPSQQTEPATKTIQQIFPSGIFPTGEVQAYASPPRDAEAREAARLVEVDIEGLREAAECHRQVRRYAQSLLRPGLSLTELCTKLEGKTEELIGAKGIERGKGFPTGCSINECAAHYTPNPGEDKILGEGDICKLDFGVQVRGRIIDCAFSIAFDPKFDPLINATKEATDVGLRAAGVDARLSEIGCLIDEVISSYEFESAGQTIPIKPIRNLTGHSIAPYRIHAGKSVPIVKSINHSTGIHNKMEEGEVYAIETFATTGRGNVQEETLNCSHYMRNPQLGFVPLRLKSAKDLLKIIDDNFGTLAFCRRWLNNLGLSSHLLALNSLVKSQLITPYPPLSDVFSSFTSQTEHTVFIGATNKEILSRGDDF